MKYNLDTIYGYLDETVPSANDWKEKFHLYFNNPHYDPVLLDNYYRLSIDNLVSMRNMLRCGYLIDEYSGLFTLDVPDVKYTHAFNMANFIRRNHVYFNKKRIATISNDYGLMNIQIIQCGLDLVFSSLPFENWGGMMMINIGNNCRPYLPSVAESDVFFFSNVFATEQQAYANWNFMIDKHLDGKEVFFSTNDFEQLKKFSIPKKMEQVEDPQSVYDDEHYANIDMGYMNKIYRIV